MTKLATSPPQGCLAGSGDLGEPAQTRAMDAAALRKVLTFLFMILISELLNCEYIDYDNGSALEGKEWWEKTSVTMQLHDCSHTASHAAASHASSI
jgi:hypothetical protein